MAQRQLRGQQSRTRLLATLILALVYYATAELSRRFAVTPQNVTPIWPPDGFAMAGVILGGLWLWPGVFLGSFLANIGAFAQTGSVFLNLLSILKVGVIALGTTLGTVLGAWSFRRSSGSGYPFQTVRATYLFLLFATLTGPIVNATFGVMALALADHVPWSEFATVWLTWWISNVAGILMLTPSLLTWGSIGLNARRSRGSQPPFRNPFLKTNGWELALVITIALIITVLSFWFSAPLRYILVLCLIWTAFRFSERELMPLTLMISSLALLGTINSLKDVGHQNFGHADVNYPVTGLQAFIGIIIITALILNALINENTQAVQDLKRLNTDLEKRVKERTTDLQRSHALLEIISQAQSQFITAGNRQRIFNHLLTQLLELTDSEFCFIGEVFLEADHADHTFSITEGWVKQRGIVPLQPHNIHNLTWNEETQRHYQEGLEAGLETGIGFDHLNTLLGAVIVTGQPVIANSLSLDVRRTGLPADVPPLHTFLGLPFYKGLQLIGVVGIANRPDGYDQSIVDYLQPFLLTCSHLIEGYRLEREKQAVETALRQSEINYQLLADSVPAVIYRYLLCPDGRDSFPYVSPYVREIYGVEPEAVLQNTNTLFSLVHPDDLNLLKREIQTAAARLEMFRSEHRIIATDGRQKWIKAIAAPELQADGSMLWRGIILEITDQKLAEQNLEEAQAFLKTVLDTSPLPLFWKDRNSSFLGYNQRFIEFLNLAHPDQLLGKTDYDIVPSEYAELYRADDRWVMETGASKLGIEETIVLGDGEEIWLEISKAPLRNSKQNIIGIVGVLQDITQRKKSQKKLLETNLKLERATRLKDEFLASMSHELRTPLNSILGMAELLSGGIYQTLTPEQAKAVKTIATSGEHLLGLINDILDLAKIEADKLELDKSTIDLQTLCEYSLQFVRIDAQKKQLDLQLSLPQQGAALQVDVRRMRQALINLLSNAVKFTPAGGRVSLLVVVKSNGIYFNVADTGIGIASSQRDKLFQPFVQIDSKLNREYSGTGLGLALVKRITELHQGKVNFTSRPGQGSCFTIHLPHTVLVSTFGQPPEQTQKPDALGAVVSVLRIPSAQPPHLVIAEDNLNTIDTLHDYLSAQGYRLSFAQNGEEAIDLIREQRPDLVLMDIQMPGMDGLAVITMLRQDPNFQHLPIIALTALAMTGDREKVLAAGATDYITKPVKLSQLDRAIRTLLSGSSTIS
jgi:PAS domain S-box-containing protein